jgi:PIN domain nuclease of toxin-antitoxin system
MKLLLDTQIVIWWLGNSRRLTPSARESVRSAHCILSVVTLWEIAIKYSIGKISVAPEYVRDEFVNAGVPILSISEAHAIACGTLPLGHGDPFDRLLLAIALAEHLPLLTADSKLADYAEAHTALKIVRA